MPGMKGCCSGFILIPTWVHADTILFCIDTQDLKPAHVCLQSSCDYLFCHQAHGHGQAIPYLQLAGHLVQLQIWY